MKRKPGEQDDPLPAGNFVEFADLFDELEAAPVFHLGFPPPAEKFIPRARVGNCPAAHNRALIGEKRD